MSKATITAIVEGVTRYKNTPNGNPRFSVDLLTSTSGYPNRVTLKLADDASLAFAIENPEYRDTPHTFELTRSGKIAYDLGAAL